MTMSKLTFFFKDIFPDFATFKSAIENQTDLTSTDVIHQYLFKRLYNRYCNSNVCYMTQEAFVRHFMERYDNVFDEMKMRLALVGKMYAITDDDLTLLNSSLNAVANNSDTALENPLDNLAPYVSMQSGVKNRSNKFEAYINALEKVKDKYLTDFLRQFQSQFFFYAIDDTRFKR